MQKANQNHELHPTLARVALAALGIWGVIACGLSGCGGLPRYRYPMGFSETYHRELFGDSREPARVPQPLGEFDPSPVSEFATPDAGGQPELPEWSQDGSTGQNPHEGNATVSPDENPKVTSAKEKRSTGIFYPANMRYEPPAPRPLPSQVANLPTPRASRN